MLPAAPSRTDPVTTPRLILTPVGPADVSDLVLLYGDPQVAFWTGPWDRQSIEAWTRDMAARWSTEGVGKWMARNREDGALVGRGGFTRFTLDGEDVLELGWVKRGDRIGITAGLPSGRPGSTSLLQIQQV